MYVVNKTIDSENSKTNFIDRGIHEDVNLLGIEYNVSKNNNEFLVFHFEKDGKTLDHTEYKPKDEDPQKLIDKTNNQIKRVKHIVTKFISEDTYNVTASTFKEFCEKTIALVGSSYVGKKVRIKVVYSNNNYTSLPNYVPFIESMSVPKEQSKLEILSIDKMVKDKPDVESNSQTNPFEKQTENDPQSNMPETPIVSSNPEDDLPF